MRGTSLETLIRPQCINKENYLMIVKFGLKLNNASFDSWLKWKNIFSFIFYNDFYRRVKVHEEYLLYIYPWYTYIDGEDFSENM